MLWPRHLKLGIGILWPCTLTLPPAPLDNLKSRVISTHRPDPNYDPQLKAGHFAIFRARNTGLVPNPSSGHGKHPPTNTRPLRPLGPAIWPLAFDPLLELKILNISQFLVSVFSTFSTITRLLALVVENCLSRIHSIGTQLSGNKPLWYPLSNDHGPAPRQTKLKMVKHTKFGSDFLKN